MSLMGLGQPVYEAERNLPMYHPGRCANIIYDGELLGTIGEIHPDVSDATASAREFTPASCCSPS